VHDLYHGTARRLFLQDLSQSITKEGDKGLAIAHQLARVLPGIRALRVRFSGCRGDRHEHQSKSAQPAIVLSKK
jgi:hypothetical protein